MAKASVRFLEGQIWTQEIPSGTINGSNKAFAIAHAPQQPLSVNLFLDGRIQSQVGASANFSISGINITMTTAPSLGQDLYAIYQY
jgi:hypothetical protein